MNKQEIWKKALAYIQKNTTGAAYKNFFKTSKIHHIDEVLKAVYIEAQKEMYANILRNRHKELLEAGLTSAIGEKYRIFIKSSSEYEEIESETMSQPAADPAPAQQPSAKDIESISYIRKDLNKQKLFNPKYTFDNFVVGDSNRFAHAACRAVAESPSQDFNPLFIYGGSGLGKTHLMHALGIYLLEHDPKLNVLYITSEMFVNEYTKALKDSKMSEFRNKYRKVDVLLIDDIQFFAKKVESQQEFFNTFNTLYSFNKQLVISSDKPPSELEDMEERLKSRFASNLTVEIAQPDYETRVAILMKKADNLKIEVDDDVREVIEYIADNIKNNIRELEGAFQTTSALATMTHEDINLVFAKRIMKDMIQNGIQSITPEKIKTNVSRYYKIKVTDMESSTRLSSIAYPRQIAMYLCRNMTDYSFEKIGKLFGGRHYSTVMHACERIEEDMRRDPSLKEDISKLKTLISE